MNIIYEVAKATQREFAAHQPQPQWEDLSEHAREVWMMVADAAISKYRDCTER